MLSLVETYEKASEYLLDKDKTSFSSNILVDVKNTITSIAGIREMDTLEKYLGLPTFLGRNKSKKFQILLDRTWAKMSNWKAKFLYGAGK